MTRTPMIVEVSQSDSDELYTRIKRIYSRI